MIPLFNYIIFTSSSSNIPVIRFTLQYFKIEKDKVLEWMNSYRNSNKKGGKISDYFFFDCTQMIFYKSDIKFEQAIILGSLNEGESDHGNKGLSSSEALEKKFEKFFDGNPLKSQGCAVFSIISKVLPKSAVRDFDLTMKFTCKEKNKGEKRISLVDYVHSLLSPRAPVESEFQVLHQYLTSRCKIPSIFILNSAFECQPSAKEKKSCLRQPAFGKTATKKTS